MRTFILNKLVRYKVFTSMQELGQKITYRALTKKEFLPALKNKLIEESKEFDPTDSRAAEELADLLEVIEQTGRELGKDFEELRKIQFERRKKRGGFDKRIYVERLGLKDDDPWAKYYASEPDRFTELKG